MLLYNKSFLTGNDISTRIEAIKKLIEYYTNFFNYAAWVTLCYGFSGRYAESLVLFNRGGILRGIV